MTQALYAHMNNKRKKKLKTKKDGSKQQEGCDTSHTVDPH
jgi:hypothetical protein